MPGEAQNMTNIWNSLGYEMELVLFMLWAEVLDE